MNVELREVNDRWWFVTWGEEQLTFIGTHALQNARLFLRALDSENGGNVNVTESPHLLPDANEET